MKYKLLKHIEQNNSLEIWAEFEIEDHRTTLDVDEPDCSVSIDFLIAHWYIGKIEEKMKEPKFHIWDKVIYEGKNTIFFSEIKHIRFLDGKYMYHIVEWFFLEENLKLASDECKNKKSNFYWIYPF